MRPSGMYQGAVTVTDPRKIEPTRLTILWDKVQHKKLAKNHIPFSVTLQTQFAEWQTPHFYVKLL